MDNGSFSDHSYVFRNMILPITNEKKEKEVKQNHYLTDIPIYDIDDLDKEGWNTLRKQLSEECWKNVTLMETEELQTLVTKKT